MKKLVSMMLVILMSVCLFAPAFAVQAGAAGSPRVLDFDVGDNHCAVVDRNNVLWMWGGNYCGQLGNGTDVDVYSPTMVMQGVKSVACESDITMAIKTDGSLWAWGSNKYGQLGNHGKYDKVVTEDYGLKVYYSMTPAKILDDVIDVSVGMFHAAAIKSDHSLWMWGLAGTLGDGFVGNETRDDEMLQTYPVKIMDGVVAVSCGYRKTVIIKEDGTLWAWEDDDYNYYIKESVGLFEIVPQKLMDSVSSVSCGERHLSILKTDGTLWMFGKSHYGELGNGVVSSQVQGPLMIMDDVAWALTGDGTTAAIRNDGTLWLWGNNHGLSLIGDYGNNLTENANTGGIQDVPAQIEGKWSGICMGSEFCLAEKSDGTLWAWGCNVHGQIGTGDTNGNIEIHFIGWTGGDTSSGGYHVVTHPTQVSIPIQGMSAWAEKEVSEAINAGLVPENLQQYYPYPVSRGDVAQMFVNLLEKSNGKTIGQIMAEKGVVMNESAFSDTADKAVLACNALDIINGVGNGRFDPDGTFTRAQIAAIVNRVARVMGIDTSGYTHDFTDVQGHWVDNELGWPVHAGIINGIGSNRFDPDGKLTTEQAIAITYRAMQALKTL